MMRVSVGCAALAPLGSWEVGGHGHAGRAQRPAADGFVGGAALFALLLWLPPPEDSRKLRGTRRACRAYGGLVGDRGSPIPATSMLPLAAGPLLGIADVETAGHGYGSSTIFLILGGCFLALALERWNSPPDRLRDHEPGRLERPRSGAGRDGGYGLCQHVGVEYLDDADDAARRGIAGRAGGAGSRSRQRRSTSLLHGRGAGRRLRRDHRRPRHADRHADQCAGAAFLQQTWAPDRLCRVAAVRQPAS